jgi:hypothetical protein
MTNNLEQPAVLREIKSSSKYSGALHYKCVGTGAIGREVLSDRQVNISLFAYCVILFQGPHIT